MPMPSIFSTAASKARWIRLMMPNDCPRWIRCYDSGPDKGADRYTVVFTGNYSGRNRRCSYLCMSGSPFHPQGVGMHGEHDQPIDRPKYSHLGKKVHFTDLPEDCQVLVMRDYLCIWGFVLDGEDQLLLADALARDLVGTRIKAAAAIPI